MLITLGYFYCDKSKHTVRISVCMLGGAVLKTIFGHHVYYRGSYGPPSRSNWTQGVQLLLEGGPYQFSNETYSNLWFSGGRGQYPPFVM